MKRDKMTFKQVRNIFFADIRNLNTKGGRENRKTHTVQIAVVVSVILSTSCIGMAI